MATPPTSDDEVLRFVKSWEENGHRWASVMTVLGVDKMTVQRRLTEAERRGYIVRDGHGRPSVSPDLDFRLEVGREKPFEVDALPSELPDIDELKALRRAEWKRVDTAKTARKLIPVRVKIDGPIGILHMGDPHVDDSGTNFPLIERDVEIINRTEGLFGANVGDLQNNWIGRLARLYAEQSTSAKASWALAEWLVTSVQWLYIIAGNHDLWAGAGDPVQWMMRIQPGVYEAHGARLNLIFPNRREVRINARHDFAGHSMWNAAHGPGKAAQIGWRDHILTCGHKHISGYQPVKDPSTGLISHAIRVASYKWHDRYADEKGLPDQNMFEAPITIIDPEATSERQLVHVVFDAEEGADFLNWKRARWKSGRR